MREIFTIRKNKFPHLKHNRHNTDFEKLRGEKRLEYMYYLATRTYTPPRFLPYFLRNLWIKWKAKHALYKLAKKEMKLNFKGAKEFEKECRESRFMSPLADYHLSRVYAYSDLVREYLEAITEDEINPKSKADTTSSTIDPISTPFFNIENEEPPVFLMELNYRQYVRTFVRDILKVKDISQHIEPFLLNTVLFRIPFDYPLFVGDVGYRITMWRLKRTLLKLPSIVKRFADRDTEWLIYHHLFDPIRGWLVERLPLMVFEDYIHYNPGLKSTIIRIKKEMVAALADLDHLKQSSSEKAKMKLAHKQIKAIEKAYKKNIKRLFKSADILRGISENMAMRGFINLGPTLLWAKAARELGIRPKCDGNDE